MGHGKATKFRIRSIASPLFHIISSALLGPASETELSTICPLHGGEYRGTPKASSLIS